MKLYFLLIKYKAMNIELVVKFIIRVSISLVFVNSTTNSIIGSETPINIKNNLNCSFELSISGLILMKSLL